MCPLPAPWKTNVLQNHLFTWQPSCFSMIFSKHNWQEIGCPLLYLTKLFIHWTCWVDKLGFSRQLKKQIPDSSPPWPANHPSLSCHHLLWFCHFLISDNTGTHNGLPGISTRIYHWPTFCLVSLHFPVPWNQSDKLLVWESLYICSWRFDLSIYYNTPGTSALGSTMPADIPVWKSL